MTLALQLVTYRSSALLGRLFASLAAQTERGWTLHVRDHSEDPAEAGRVAAALAASGLPYTFEAGPNIGFAAGHNALFARHDAAYVATVNPDIDFEPDYYAELLRALAVDSGLGSVQGVLLRGERGSGMVDSLGLRVLGFGDVRDLGAGESFASWRARLDTAAMAVFGVCGAAPVYRRSALAVAASTHGPFFDARFFLYKEDVELAVRLFRAGFAAACVPSACAFHLRAVGRTTLLARFRDEFRRSARVRVSSYVGQWRIYLLHGGWRQSPAAWLRTVFAEGGRTVGGLLFPPTLLVRAWRETLNGRASLLASRRAYDRIFPRRWRP